MRKSFFSLLLVLMLVAMPAAASADAGGNSAATVAASLSDGCRDFQAQSSKDISHVEIHYADGRVVKDEDVASRDFSIDGGAGDEIDFVVVKSGTMYERFECDSGPPAVCSDGIDNDGNGLTDFPADPGCSSPEDNDEATD